MADYSQKQLSAYNKILDAGVLGNCIQVTSTYDSVTETEVITGVIQDNVALVTFPASKGTVQSFDNRIIEDYKRGKIRFFMMAGYGMTFEPKSGDMIKFNDKFWEIVGTTPLSPDGTTVIYYTVGIKESNLDSEGVYGEQFAKIYA